jgi:hypothetical protein
MHSSIISSWVCSFDMDIFLKKEDPSRKNPNEYDPFHRPDELPPIRDPDFEPGVAEPDSPYDPSKPNEPEAFTTWQL